MPYVFVFVFFFLAVLELTVEDQPGLELRNYTPLPTAALLELKVYTNTSGLKYSIPPPCPSPALPLSSPFSSFPVLFF